MKLKRKLMAWKIVSWGLRLSVALFHLFFYCFYFDFSFICEVEIVQEWKSFCELRTLLKAHPPFHFLAHLMFLWLNLYIHIRLLFKGAHFKLL
jgi:hypothetical protein